MKKHHRHENDCLNCGTELQGQFCHVCGQENLHVKEPFWHFVSHSISHYFHFDSKFFSTLKPLLTQPGQLTLDYLAGRRTRYLHPVSMYIFVSIVYFLVVPNLHPKNEKHVTIKKADTSKKASVVSVTNAHDTIRKKSDTVRQATRSIKSNNQLEKSITDAITSQPMVKRGLMIDSLQKVNKLHPSKILEAKIDSLNDVNAEITEDQTDKVLDGNSKSGFVRSMFHVFKAIRTPEFKKELEHYQPKLYFILMPLFAFFLMLNFRRNHRYYVEHIVFTIHFFTAFFIFEIVVEPINYFIFHNSDIIDLLTFGVVLWYSYTGLTKFYQRTKGATIRKMITLSIFLGIAFTISYTIIGTIVYLITA